MKIITRILCIILSAAMLITGMEFSGAEAAETKTVSSDIKDMFVDNENGTVSVTFNNADNLSILVLVDNLEIGDGANRYCYKLGNGENKVVIPLTEGAGEYKLRICKVRDDGKAVVLYYNSVKLEESKADDVFETASIVVDYGVSDTFIRKAKSLTKSCKTDTAKIKKIYNYIIKNFAYDYELKKIKADTQYYLPSNLTTYSRKLGICYDISCLLAGMLRGVGIEARVVTGNTPNVSAYHAWNRVYDSSKKKWYTIDATYDMCKYNSGVTKGYTMIKKDSEYSDIVYTY